MEVAGLVFRQPVCFSFGAGVGTVDVHSSSSSFSSLRPSPSSSASSSSIVSLRTRKVDSMGFRDKGHLQYYFGGGYVMCGEKKKQKDKEKEKECSTKNKLKLLKGLSKDLSMLSQMNFGVGSDDGLVGQVQGKLISEAAEVLMKQLEQLRAEEKELKRKKKEEKAKLKASRIKIMPDRESSSSESSDSECGEVIDMSCLESEAAAVVETMPIESQILNQVEASSTLPMCLTEEVKTVEMNGFQDHGLQTHHEECCGGPQTSCSNANNVNPNGSCSSETRGMLGKRIEVCMGNKCKKSGGTALLEEFERVMDVEGAVVGCKCMGKCRDGPNVRVLYSVDGGISDSVRTPANPLCIGVGLEDVGVIVANFFGEHGKDLVLIPAA